MNRKDMKIFGAFFLLAVLGLVACNSEVPVGEDESVETIQEKKENGNAEIVSNSVSAFDQPKEGNAEIEFEEKVYDFGAIKEGEVVEHAFTFKNTGNRPLSISGTNTSCGCTTPEWPREPIMPGESGKISVRFDSKGKSGTQNKQIAVMTNTVPNQTTLRLVGEVKK